MTVHTPRAIRVGWSANDCAEGIRLFTRGIKQTEALEQSGTGLIPEMKHSLLSDSMLVAIHYYLLDDLVNAKLWAMYTLDRAEDYFFGAWRDQVPVSKALPPSREFQDKKRLWVDQLQIALTFSACLAAWERFDRFASFPRDDIKSDEGISAASDAFWLYFCGVIRERSPGEIQGFRQRIVQGKKKLDKLLLVFLDSGIHNLEGVQHAANEYFTAYRRTEAKRDYVTSKLALDGSMVLHYVNHLGRKVSVPEAARDHIVEF